MFDRKYAEHFSFVLFCSFVHCEFYGFDLKMASRHWLWICEYVNCANKTYSINVEPWILKCLYPLLPNHCIAIENIFSHEFICQFEEFQQFFQQSTCYMYVET